MAALAVKNVQLRSDTIVIDNIGYLIQSLKDNQQFDEEDNLAKELGISDATWPLFGIVWPSSIILALQVYKLKLDGKRVLEIGCGIALSSIVLHRMGVDITASDYHPGTLGLLNNNVIGNGLDPIKYQVGNWETENPLLGKFDYVIGSDVLYQPAHVLDVSQFINRHSSNNVEVMIIDPGRENRSKFTRSMTELGYQHQFERFDQQVTDDTRCKGRILHYQRHLLC